MSEITAPGSPALSREQEEAAFYHEAELNRSWTAIRLGTAVFASGIGAFLFAYFYLRSLNSYGNWYPPGFTGPQMGFGTAIYGMVVVSAVAQSLGLTRIKAGSRSSWSMLALIALVLGLAAVALQIFQLTDLPFQPGASGFASVFVGFSPVFAVIVLGCMIWLEIMIMRGRSFADVSFTEQPPTFKEAAALQRFQAGLSAFSFFWNFIAIVAIVFWVLFYVVH